MAGFDIWIGRQKLDEMDWRADGALADDNDDDDLTEAPAEVVSFLGFDPFEEDEPDPDSVDGDSATTAGNETANAIFDKAKQKYNELDDIADAASKRLNAIAGPVKGPMGLTPEHIRLSPEYRKAKAEYDQAAKALKTFAAWYVKQFKKEIMAERRDPNYHAKRQAEIRARKAAREQGGIPIMASSEEMANATIRSLKRLPKRAASAQRASRKMSSVQRPVNVRARDTQLNRTKPGMRFLHKTEEVGGRPAEMKVFAVKGGSIYYDEPEARKPGFYCDPNYFYSKIFKEWVK